MSQLFHQRLDTLAPKISRISRSTAGTFSEYDPDDLCQHICLKLLERAAADPAFAARSDEELLTFAIWRARSKAEAGRTYTRYVDAEVFIEEDGDEISVLEMMPSGEINPEDAVIQSETLRQIDAIVQDLTPVNRQIVEMLYLGHSQVEIAAALGISKSAVTQRKTTIAHLLTEALS